MSHQFECDGCGRIGNTDDLCEPEGECPDEECEGTTHLCEVEYTIGVCVPMKWDSTKGRYALDGDMTTTDGGLFADACVGAWSPSLDEWINNAGYAMETAHNEAQGIVAAAIREENP